MAGMPANAFAPIKSKFQSPFCCVWIDNTETLTTGCAIVGALFHPPLRNSLPKYYVGIYFFADLCSG